jgi:ADP-heptose:LPS heptosyltransferase
MGNTAIRCRSWGKKYGPKKILAIRFQAMGDLMITFPYLQSLKELHPDMHLHLLTREEVSDIPKSITLFEKVFSVSGGRNAKLQLFFTLLLLPRLWLQRYDVVADLQNHRISRFVRRLLNVKAWSEFDRSSKVFAGERTRLTLDELNIGKSTIATGLQLKINTDIEARLKANGWNGQSSLLILNPAGAFASRKWPTENYIAFSKLWKARHPEFQFLILGLKSLKSSANIFKNELGSVLIDLTDNTSPTEAYAITKMSTLILTEDSGLMHMAWTQGVPTLALFGSTPSYWSSPLGRWSKCLSSADLPCGDCFQQECIFGDVHCLTRYTPQQIVAEAESLLATSEKEKFNK